ncbi:Serine/threonine-protein kinase PknD [Candidatus Entotheonellaceae bacterium PAL068K]
MSHPRNKPMNWITVTESQHPWERDALEFVRNQFPQSEPYRAWTNFEFIADDGSINEVDLLVCTPQGFFFIEIKSREGRVFGDAGTWTWEKDGRLTTTDNPVVLANTKAKKLRSLLQRQKACRRRLPFLEVLVFCSAPDVRCNLPGTARYRVCLRDREKEGDQPARPGIMAAIKRRDGPGLDSHPRGTCDRPTTKMISQAMEQAGIRPSQRHRKVGDFVLDQLIEEGPGYQDWQATHVRLPDAKRRVRIYTVRTGATVEERQTIERAAQREAQLLEMLQHPSILRREGFTEHELGPALIFEHDAQALRLDHFMAQRQDKLAVDVRLDLVRQIAEVIRFAHDKKVVHRALSPHSILVTHSHDGRFHLKIFNWQAGYRQGNSTSGVSREVTATAHVDRLVEDASTAYMAPEALSDTESTGEHLDVFSLGAIAYHLFSGEPPAANGLELSNKLRESKGLQISSVLNGAGESLQFLVHFSTHPEVTNRIDSAADFLGYLDEVEDELTAPDYEFVEDPTLAQKGDRLPGNFTVAKRLGQGACSVALLVERDGEAYVLKVASDPEHNDRLKDEGEVLQKLRHQHVVEYCDMYPIGDRMGVLMRRAGPETLGQRLRKEGGLHVDMLQRFGEDLLGVVSYLEEQGIPHRDIKPDNIGVGPVGRGDRLHLVLFDFSLSRTGPENIRAGTTGYLDPLLPLRKPPRWDLHAERYAAAVTLYELAAGPNHLPRWGDGTSDPSHLACEVTIEAELFEADLRDGLTNFFTKALRRNPGERFDNGEEMLRAWRLCFEGIEQPGTLSDYGDEDELYERLAHATFDTQIPELGLGTRATNALDRANILTIEELMTVPLQRLQRLRGVGNKTRREISTAVKILRQRLGSPNRSDMTRGGEAVEPQTELIDIGNLSVDLLAQRAKQTTSRDGEAARHTLQALLGLDPQLHDSWPSQSDVARYIAVTRARIGQFVGKFQQRWAKEPAITKLRGDIVDILTAAGGVMSVSELSAAVLVARGSVRDEPCRSRLATAVTRAALEAERTIAKPRCIVRRTGERVWVATNPELGEYAFRLGHSADQLAAEDPLAPPARVLQKLRTIALPSGAEGLSDVRLVRLAAAVSGHAAVSSRQELYPKGMDATRALKLSQGALLGVPFLTVAQIRERVSSRYPEAAPLPDRPVLDDLLHAAGFDFQWDATARQGASGYVSRLPETLAITSGSDSVSRLSTVNGPPGAGEVTPEIADARQFEERLQRAMKDSAFLVLMVHPRYYQRACEELCGRFPIKLIDFEALFIKALHEVAENARVNWELVLKTDARPYEGDWNKLLLLVGRAMPLVEEQLLSADTTMLVVYAGVLARYDRMDLLERLRDKIGRRDGIPGLWLLLPGQDQAVMDGKAVPIISPGQRANLPESWLQNVHRGRRA